MAPSDDEAPGVGRPSIGVIDLHPFLHGSPEDQKKVAEEWKNVMEKVGFVVITNHGVDNELISQLRSQAKDFFAEPLSEKKKHHKGPYGCGLGGYTGIGVESVNRSEGNPGAADSPPDLVESYVFRPEQDHPVAMRDTLAKYFNRMEELLQQLHELSALSLGLPRDFFDSYYEGTTGNILRLAYYPPFDPAKTKPGQLRYGAHTDYQGFTILRLDPDDTENCLELDIHNNDTWESAVSVPDSFVVNIGDLWEIWTNGRWKSTRHRVANPTGPTGSRLTLPFFSGPRDDAYIVPMKADQETTSRFQPTSAGEHLKTKHTRSNV